jgi:hypothetical protein
MYRRIAMNWMTRLGPWLIAAGMITVAATAWAGEMRIAVAADARPRPRHP